MKKQTVHRSQNWGHQDKLIKMFMENGISLTHGHGMQLTVVQQKPKAKSDF